MTTAKDLTGVYQELVTHAHARDVALPHGAGTLVLVTLDNGHDHTKPTTLGPQGLGELDGVLAATLARDDIAALAITGKPYFFSVGADLKGVGALRTSEQARAMAELGHAVFDRLRTASIPTFAFVNGAAMGGGLELALHCRYRTISETVPAVALPETFLGLVPGWGGATLVPRLVGTAGAVRLIIENPLENNRMLRAKEAYELGLADAILGSADFLEQSILWAAAIVTGDIEVSRTLDESSEDRGKALARGRAVAEARRHGAAPAPLAALELIGAATDRPVEESIGAEIDTLTTLMLSEEFRASVYAFDLVQRRAKRPAGAPDRSLARPVTKVGVVGAGLMAGQLALLFARRLGVPVVMTDLDQERVDKGLAYVQDEIAALQAKRRIDIDTGNRLRALVTGSVDRAAYADADLVIEAVFEDLDVKRRVFAELESIVSSTCVLATNTSSLSVTAMAAGLVNPERVVGFHFFNPVAVLPLLEVVRGESTDDATLATAFAVGRELKKSCVLVKDAPAFVVNRLLTRFIGSAAAAVDAGTSIEVADGALLRLGLPMAPFDLLGLVGPAVALHVAETMHSVYPDRFTVSPGLRRLVEAGKRGVWTGPPGTVRTIDPEVTAILGAEGGGWSADEVRERALRALAEEIAIMLDEGVVADVRDIDLAMILGAGWPFHLGGIAPYLDRTGVSDAVNGRRFLPRGVASLPDDAAELAAPVAQEAGLEPPVPPTVTGELTSTGLRVDLPSTSNSTARALVVDFAMPLPVAQIGMFAGRALPVPATMFRASLREGEQAVPVDVTKVAVVSAADGQAVLDLAGVVRRSSAGGTDEEIVVQPTVRVG